MRVLSVGNMYPPHHLGGYELVWRAAVRHLRERGWTVRVLTTDTRFGGAAGEEDPDVHRELRWYWRDHEWPRLSPRARLALERHNHRVLIRHLRELQPDAVAWWSMGGMSLSLVERVRRDGPPAAGFVHDDWLRYGPRVDQWTRMWARAGPFAATAERRYGIPTRAALAGAARWAFVSEAMRRNATAALGALPDTAVAPSGIDLGYLERRAPPGEWRWRLVCPGRIDRRKGIATAIEALAYLPAEATLRVVGEGDERHLAELRELAARRRLEARVEFAGALTRDELPDAYAAADVTVFPVTWEEPWGLVPLESMAVGRPVVATGRGGSGEYLRDGDNALLFPAGDARGLAAAVRRLAGDPALRERLREGGFATAPRHTEPVFHETVEDHLRAVAAK